ncbi:MAG: hypothetical protein DRJ03_22330 [Chloroflexi bacterium]|nr:MAG: hypothetical protein DRI81_09490 [Chloroflexota bacterium]RLC80099.1 MAG: hypothetical protein DRJ03_22330 [Chloroflexota bacterium]
MTSEQLVAAAALLLALLFEYVPGLQRWYDGLGEDADNKTYKRLVMLACLAAVAGGAYVLSCVLMVEQLVTCDAAGVWGLVRLFVAAVVVNQSAYLIAPRRKSPQR